MLEDLPLPRMRDYGVRSPGHEGAGIVVGMGSLVKNWNLGDRAGIKPTWDACMSCHLCLNRLECHCSEAIPTGLKVSGKSLALKHKSLLS
jgi:propanol-preferring alcohol dehydrogenase